ncbi:glycosyltransferase family 2 protein [Chryseobacterium echinoideorum]|uniref:glycosyltransferase family 2 protein n=1 Tax=Chryseobacterium echinoideorum TaxID=1549648 RepID=UPI0011868FF4|nr:glycosyltransferase family 2 protein [Chryseobacterium echinoideorum]
MAETLVSIIVPCYNQAEYLDECIQSVLDQTYSHWECLIINDGSLDNTDEVVDKWLKKDPRFFYYKTQNGGVCSARNLGIEKSNGSWLLPLDGDDKIGKDYLSEAIKKTEEGYGLIYCSGMHFGMKNTPLYLPEYSFKELLRHNIIFCSALFNKEVLGSIRYDKNLVHGLEDWEFWISYLSQNNIKVLKLPDVHFFYRIKEVSRNQSVTDNKEKSDETKFYIFNKHKNLYDKFYGDYFTVINQMAKLESQNIYYHKILNSKKYKTISRILDYIHRITP